MKVALVGAELEENLGLSYMAAALEKNGHFVDQIQARRQNIQLKEYRWTKPGPGIEEPAHFRRDDLVARPDMAAIVLTEIAEVLKRHGF